MRLEERFEVIKALGRGAFGEVLLVRDPNTQRLYAAKVLIAKGADAYRRFSNEARQLGIYALIKMPNVVRIEATFLNATPPFFLMTWAKAGSILPWAGRMRPRQVLLLMKQLVQTLSLIHLTGGFHRDVKPDNILLLGDGSGTLSDFGLGNQPLGGGAMTNSPTGTTGYAAPELFEGAPFTSACDLYSVGATGFHLLTGLHPKSFSPPLHAISMDPVAWIHSAATKTLAVYAALTPIILQMTNQNPATRAAAAAALLLCAQAFEADSDLLPTGPPPLPSKEERLVAGIKKLAQVNH